MTVRKALSLVVVCASCLSLFSQTADSLQQRRYVVRATSYGIGRTNVFDTYLSPQEYTGMEFRLSRESMRMTKLLGGGLSVQSLFQAHLAYTDNRAGTGNSFSGLASWSYTLHYHFPINEHLKLLAGAAGELNGGCIYNLRNSNNPVSAKAYIDIAASGMAIWHFSIKHYPMTLRYQVNLPVMGLMFSPNHQQSYYEIFSLGNTDGIVRFTSLHNHPSVRQMLSMDIPIRYTKMRFSYVCDLQQARLNGLRSHTYSHVFMAGFVKTLYRIRDKRPQPTPVY